MKNDKSRNRPGFTLAELLVSLAISGVLLSALFGAIIATQKGFVKQRDSRMAEEALRQAEQVLRTVLSSALADPRSTGQALLDPDYLNTGLFNNLRVKSDFNPPDNDFLDELEDVSVRVDADTLLVQWTAGAGFKPLAYPVRAMRMQYYDAAGATIATKALVVNARSTLVTLTAPASPTSSQLLRRETWVFLRNRRP